MNRVFWITGLSGAGKTTVGKELYKFIKEKESNVVFLDGDELREVFGQDLGYSREERFRCAMRYSRICELLAKQGINVVICTISMFEEVREWNRAHIIGYYEVYLKVPLETLKKRNQKGLYSGIEEGVAEEVVGLDLQLELPQNPTLTIENWGDITPQQVTKKIICEAYR